MSRIPVKVAAAVKERSGGVPTEMWVDAVGFVGFYEVSDLGNIRSFARKGTPGKVLAPWVNKRGYRAVALSKGCQRKVYEVHKVVAAAFLGPRAESWETRHLNGDSLDNRLVNLAYGTRSENTFDRVVHGTHHMSSRDQCKHGHEFTPANTVYRNGTSTRLCVTCKRSRSAASRTRHPRIIPAAVRASVLARSGGVCEACGTEPAQHIHHRLMRSQGGKHEAGNLLHVSFRCHERIHHNPAESYAAGWLIHSWETL